MYSGPQSDHAELADAVVVEVRTGFGVGKEASRVRTWLDLINEQKRVADDQLVRFGTLGKVSPDLGAHAQHIGVGSLQFFQKFDRFGKFGIGGILAGGEQCVGGDGGESAVMHSGGAEDVQSLTFPGAIALLGIEIVGGFLDGGVDLLRLGGTRGGNSKKQ